MNLGSARLVTSTIVYRVSTYRFEKNLRRWRSGTHAGAVQLGTMPRGLGRRLYAAAAPRCHGCARRGVANSAAVLRAKQPVVQMAAKDRHPWWPSSLVSLCSLGVDVVGALETTAAHVRATLRIPEEWQPPNMVIDAGRLRGAAAKQLDAARELTPSLPSIASVEDFATAADSAVERLRSPLASRVAAAASHIEGGLLDRNAESRLLLLGALAGQHVLLVGPPGTGKSRLGSRLAEVLDADSFTCQLSRFSTPEELFGPLSLKALKNDQYVRQTEGYLPSAGIACSFSSLSSFSSRSSFASFLWFSSFPSVSSLFFLYKGWSLRYLCYAGIVFIDEVFKGNTALLNSLLGIMAERLFEHGSTRTSLDDLRCIVGASHHPPDDGDALAALYDRFLIRRHVAPLSHSRRMSLLEDAEPPLSPPAPDAIFSIEECKTLVQAAAETVQIPDEVGYVLAELPKFLSVVTSGSLLVSDRRLVASADLLRVAAYVDGRPSVDLYDCLLLRHVLWDRPSVQLKIDQWFAEKLAGAQAAYLEQAVVKLLLDGFLSSSAQPGTGRDVLEAAEGGLDAALCVRLRAGLGPIRAALGGTSMYGQSRAASNGGCGTAADAAVLAGHVFLTSSDLEVLRWKRQRAWQKRKQNKAASEESNRLSELRQAVEQLEAFLRLPPPLHACALLCVAPKFGRSVLAKLFEPETSLVRGHSGDANGGAIGADGVLKFKRGMALLEVIGHASFNQRLWSRMNNPVHSGGQSRLVSHHNNESRY